MRAAQTSKVGPRLEGPIRDRPCKDQVCFAPSVQVAVTLPPSESLAGTPSPRSVGGCAVIGPGLPALVLGTLVGRTDASSMSRVPAPWNRVCDFLSPRHMR